MKTRALFIAAAVALATFAGCKKSSSTDTLTNTDGTKTDTQQEAAYAANEALADSKAKFYIIADLENVDGQSKMNIQSSGFSLTGGCVYECFGTHPYSEYEMEINSTSGSPYFNQVICFISKDVINSSSKLTSPGECSFKPGKPRFMQFMFRGAPASYGSATVFSTPNIDTTSSTKPYINITEYGTDNVSGNYIKGRFSCPFYRPYGTAAIMKNGVFKLKVQ